MSRQQQAGQVTRHGTRRVVLDAARAEFEDRGYTAATVRRIADRADVSVQSLYASWGSKRQLLRGVMVAALTGDSETQLGGGTVARIWELGLHDEADAHTVLRHVAGQFCRVAETAAVGWRTYLEAIGTDADIAGDWQELMTVRRENFRTHIDRINVQELRTGLSPATAADTAWAIASPQTYDLMVRRAGYTMKQFEPWLCDTLCAALLRAY